MSPGAKKFVGVVVIILALYFVISNPTGAGALVQNLINLLQRGAESLITFLQSILP
jgi:hypothetical protein